MRTILSIIILFAFETGVSESQQPRSYSLAEVLRTLEPSGDYEHPAPLKHAVPVGGNQDTVLLVTMHGGRDRPDRISLWKKLKDLYSEIVRLESSPEGPLVDFFEEPNVFQYQGEQFLHIAHWFTGTGNYHEDTLFVVHPNGEVQGVFFEPAPEGCKHLLAEKEAVWKGEMNDFADDKMEFVFGIWNIETDANCCPTAGKVQGAYKLVKEKALDAKDVEYKITVDRFQRLPVEEN